MKIKTRIKIHPLDRAGDNLVEAQYKDGLFGSWKRITYTYIFHYDAQSTIDRRIAEMRDACDRFVEGSKYRTPQILKHPA